MPMISAHDRHTLVAGAAAVTMILVASRLGPRVIAWNTDMPQSAALLDARVASEEASIRSVSVMRDSLVARDVRLANMDSLILEGSTPTLAGANLAELVSDLADSSRLQLGNVQIRVDTLAHTAFLTLSVQASATGDLAAVTRFLSSVESAPKLLTVRELAITAESNRTPESGELLHADVVIHGLAGNPLANRSAGR